MGGDHPSVRISPYGYSVFRLAILTRKAAMNMTRKDELSYLLRECPTAQLVQQTLLMTTCNSPARPKLHTALASRFSPVRFDPLVVITPPQLDTMLDAARKAPCAGNSQPECLSPGYEGTAFTQGWSRIWPEAPQRGHPLHRFWWQTSRKSTSKTPPIGSTRNSPARSRGKRI